MWATETLTSFQKRIFTEAQQCRNINRNHIKHQGKMEYNLDINYNISFLWLAAKILPWATLGHKQASDYQRWFKST